MSSQISFIFQIGAGNRELAAEVEEKEQQILSLNSELDELEREMSNNTTVHEQVVSKLKQVGTLLIFMTDTSELKF